MRILKNILFEPHQDHMTPYKLALLSAHAFITSSRFSLTQFPQTRNTFLPFFTWYEK